MNEPTVFRQPFSAGVSSWDTIALDAVQGPTDEQTNHAEVHNLYGHTMARACYEGLRQHRPEKRPFVLGRSGFAGSQRWTAFWMGDNHSWWDHLEMAMPQLLNMGLSGIPFVGTDIGGFFGHGSGELFARWMQFGILSPLCRGHSSLYTTGQEPWVFGPEIESICRDYLQLRYRLLPYLYTLFWEAAQQGSPILRPLFYHFPDDPATYQLHDQVLLGPFLMAAPVYQPGRTHRSVYLPEGPWYDWWDGTRIMGPTHILAHAPLERMPLYVRGGAIIPTGPDMSYTDEYALNPLTLQLYPGSGRFHLYEDDGESFAYEQGQFCTTTFSLHGGSLVANRPARSILALTLGARTGSYTPPPRQLILHLHGVSWHALDGHPSAVYDEDQRMLTLQRTDDGQAQTLLFQMGPYSEF